MGLALAVLSGAVTSGLGYALWYAILPKLGAARAGVAQLTVPVLAASGGALLLAEGVTLRFVMAALLVLGGVALALAGTGAADRSGQGLVFRGLTGLCDAVLRFLFRSSVSLRLQSSIAI